MNEVRTDLLRMMGIIDEAFIRLQEIFRLPLLIP